VAAEPEGVRQAHDGHGAVSAQRPRAVRDVIEVEAFLGLLVAQCRRRDAVAQRQRATASTAPAAPSRWPIADFVDETGTRVACSPSAAFSALVSERSLSGVDVPCALT
jgi:hypothetical protein